MSQINEKSETPQEKVANSEKQAPSAKFNYQICAEPDRSKIVGISKKRCWPWSGKKCKKRKSQAIKLLQMCSDNVEYIKFRLPEYVRTGDRVRVHLEPNFNFYYIVLAHDKPGSELNAMVIGRNNTNNQNKSLKKEDYDIWKDDDFWNKYLAANVIVGVGEGMLEGVANGLSSTSDIAAAGLSGSSEIADASDAVDGVAGIGEGISSMIGFDGGKIKRKRRMTKKGRKMRKKRTTQNKNKKQNKKQNKNKKRKSRKMKRRRSRRKR